MQIVRSSTRETGYACQNSLYFHVSEISDVIGATLAFYENWFGSKETLLRNNIAFLSFVNSNESDNA